MILTTHLAGDAARWWPQARRLIVRASRKLGRNDIREIERHVFSGRDLLWVLFDGRVRAAAVTSLLTADNRKECFIRSMSGEGFHVWGRYALNEIERYAKAYDCKVVSFVGRKGWRKWLSDYSCNGDEYEKVL